MSMPKTAMNENYSPPTGKNEVWPTGQIPVMESKSITQSMDESANDEFRFRILTVDARHPLASLDLQEGIDQS